MMVSFGVLNIILHLVFRGPKKGTIVLTTTHMLWRPGSPKFSKASAKAPHGPWLLPRWRPAAAGAGVEAPLLTCPLVRGSKYPTFKDSGPKNH